MWTYHEYCYVCQRQLRTQKRGAPNRDSKKKHVNRECNEKHMVLTNQKAFDINSFLNLQKPFASCKKILQVVSCLSEALGLKIKKK